MWGNVPQDYTVFCENAFNASSGVIADIGCGTLEFTYKVYAGNEDKELFLCDISEEMLKIRT
jgi:ubiquinone/menaquinone biosynthesis C-methylase UbiE